ncbi:hypothetical protein TgHK011_005127 [Trichoderma gracile]|nr:hypothetical protein TgHK011_005127 [Trichoderma gracile]
MQCTANSSSLRPLATGRRPDNRAGSDAPRRTATHQAGTLVVFPGLVPSLLASLLCFAEPTCAHSLASTLPVRLHAMYMYRQTSPSKPILARASTKKRSYHIVATALDHDKADICLDSTPILCGTFRYRCSLSAASVRGTSLGANTHSGIVISTEAFTDVALRHDTLAIRPSSSRRQPYSPCLTACSAHRHLHRAKPEDGHVQPGPARRVDTSPARIRYFWIYECQHALASTYLLPGTGSQTVQTPDRQLSPAQQHLEHQSHPSHPLTTDIDRPRQTPTALVSTASRRTLAIQLVTRIPSILPPAVRR